MANRSSTSSFRSWTRLPLAGLLAAGIFFLVDFFVLGVSGPWPAFTHRVEGALARGVVNDRLQLRALREAPEDQRRVVVVGSSRANAGFLPGVIPPHQRVGLAFGKLAHAGIGISEIRSSVDEILDFEIDAFVIVLSEFDTNRSVRAVPNASFGSLSTIWDLVAEIGPRACFKRRAVLFRLTAAGLFKSYRFRQVLHSAFVDDLRRFELDDRFPAGRGSATSAGGTFVKGGQRKTLTPQDREMIKARIRETFPHLSNSAVKIVFQQVHQITRGPHSEIQAGLLRRTVRRLSAAGVEVVIAEAPVHPLARELYDPEIRRQFLTMASSLERDFGSRFIPLEASGPYAPEEFKDMTHLDPTGAAKLTNAIVTTLNSSSP